MRRRGQSAPGSTMPCGIALSKRGGGGAAGPAFASSPGPLAILVPDEGQDVADGGVNVVQGPLLAAAEVGLGRPQFVARLAQVLQGRAQAGVVRVALVVVRG